MNCLCIFESDTVKSECPVCRKIMKLVYFTSFTVFSGDIKKEKK